NAFVSQGCQPLHQRILVRTHPFGLSDFLPDRNITFDEIQGESKRAGRIGYVCVGKSGCVSSSPCFCEAQCGAHGAAIESTAAATSDQKQ
ncbi:MAG: hypothetical protein OEY21_07815, partial [Nitrospira sp.]|nr:hypothetical protein [Nitrospira sp.]